MEEKKIDKRDVQLIIRSVAESLDSDCGYTFLDEVTDEYPEEAVMTITEQNF